MKDWVATYSNRPQPSDLPVPDERPGTKPRERPAPRPGRRSDEGSQAGTAGLASLSDSVDGVLKDRATQAS